MARQDDPVKAYLRTYGRGEVEAEPRLPAVTVTDTGPRDPVDEYLRRYGPGAEPDPEPTPAPRRVTLEDSAVLGGEALPRDDRNDYQEPTFRYPRGTRPGKVALPSPQPGDVTRRAIEQPARSTRTVDPRSLKVRRPAAPLDVAGELFPEGTPKGRILGPRQEPTKSYRDPIALAQTIARADRIADGKEQVNPATEQPYTEAEREHARFVGQSLRFRQEREESKGGFARRAADAASFGQVNRQAYRDIREAARDGDLVTAEDLETLGVTDRSGALMRTEPSFRESVTEEMLPMMAGQLPYLAIGPEMAAVRATAQGVARVTGRGGIARALELAAANEAPTATTALGRAGQRMITGGVPGTYTGAAADLVTERNRGATLGEAATAAGINAAVGFGVGGGIQVGAGAVRDVAVQTAKRFPQIGRFLRDEGAVSPGVQLLRENADRAELEATPDLRASFARQQTLGTLSERLDNTPEVRQADVARAAEGRLPLSDQTPDAQYRQIAEGLQQLAERRQVEQLPSPEAEALDAQNLAAIRAGDQVFTGPSHLDAAERARQAGADLSAVRREDEGFWTTHDRFISREEAETQFGARRSEDFEEPPPEATELVAARDDVIAETQPTLRGSADFSQQLEPIEARRAKYQQLRINLARNADNRLQQAAASERLRRQTGEHRLPARTPDERERQRRAYDRVEAEREGQLPIRGEPLDPRAEIEQWERYRTLGQLIDDFGPDWMSAAKRAVKAYREAGLLPPEHLAIALTAVGAGAASDEEELGALGGVAALSTAGRRTPGLYSRLRRTIETLDFGKSQPKPAVNWIGKLANQSTFAREEFDRYLKPALEQAAREKRQLTRDDVLQLYDDTAVGVERVLQRDDYATVKAEGDEFLPAVSEPTAPGGRDIEGIAPETVRDTPEDEIVAITDLDDMVLRPGEVADQYRLRKERAERIETDMASQLEDAQIDVNRLQRRVEQYRDDIGNALPNAVHRLERELDRAMGEIEGDHVPRDLVQDVVNYIQGHYDTPPNEPKFEEAISDGWRIRSEGSDEMYLTDGTRTVTAREIDPENPGAVAAFELWAKAEREGWLSLGGDDYLLPSHTITWDSEAEEWVLTTRGRTDYRDADRDALVQFYVNENFQLTDDGVDWDQVHSEVSSWADAVAEWKEADSQRYYLDPDENDDAFRDERDEIDTLKEEMSHLEEELLPRALGRFAPLREVGDIYGLLLPRDREFVDRARAMGAIGTSARLWDNEGRRLRQDSMTRAEQFVYDPDVPHTPLPEPPEYRYNDPDQLDMDLQQPALPVPEEGVDPLAAVRAAAQQPIPGRRLPNEPVIEPQAVRGERFRGVQEIGAGSNYFEILNKMVGPGASTGINAYTAGHWGSYEPNIVAHSRGREVMLSNTPGLTGLDVAMIDGDPAQVRTLKSDLRAVRLDLQRLFREQRKVFEEYRTYTAEQRKLDPTLPRDEQDWRGERRTRLNDMATRLRDWIDQSKTAGIEESKFIARIREEYRNAGVDLSEGELAVVVGELQSDYAVDATETGVRQPLDPGEYARLSAKQDELRQRETRLSQDIDQLNSANAAKWRELRRAVSHVWPSVGPSVDSQDYASRVFPPSEFFNLTTQTEFLQRWDERVVERSMPESLLEYDPRKGISDIAGLHQDRTDFQAIHDQVTEELNQIQTRINQGTDGVPPSPWVDTVPGLRLNVASALLYAIERGAERFAWQDGATAYNVHSMKSVNGANEIYNNFTPSQVKFLLGTLGEKDPKIEELYIRGYRHLSVVLTPEIRDKGRRLGLPILAALAMVGAPAVSAEAQSTLGGEEDQGASLLITGAVVGSALLAMRSLARRKGGRLPLDARRALKIDEATGLSNKQHFEAQRAALDENAGQQWLVFDSKPTTATGDAVMKALDEAGVPVRAFHLGGGRIAVALPAEQIAPAYTAIVDQLTPDDIGVGSTFEDATASLSTTPAPAPAGNGDAALRAMTRAGAAAALGAAIDKDHENEMIGRMTPALYGLAAMHLIGLKRLRAGGGAVGRALVDRLRRSRAGYELVYAMNPDALLDPQVLAAIRSSEETVAQGRARAQEMLAEENRIGGRASRTASDLIENEAWEDAAALSPEEAHNALALAAQIAAEEAALTADKLALGVIPPNRVLPNYLPRRYAEYEVLDAIGNRPGQGQKTRISEVQKRKLDEPIREAQAALAAARATGTPQTIADAEAALGEAQYVQLTKRMELGEIREAGYRAAYMIEKGHRDIAAAQLFGTLRGIPGIVHPEYLRHLNDFLAARAAGNKADMDAAFGEMAAVRRGFETKEGAYVALPDSKGLGVLRGMVLQREVANSINGLPTWGKVDAFVNFWKQSKTVFNPGTHIGNVASNISVAHMNGMSVLEQPLWLGKAAKDIKQYGLGTRVLAELGILDQNVVTAGGQGMDARFRSEEHLQDLRERTTPETAAVFNQRGLAPRRPEQASVAVGALAGTAVGGALGALDDDEGLSNVSAAMAVLGAAAGGAAASRTFRRKARRLYNNEDNIFRVAMFLQQRAQGKTVREAAEAARQAFGDFRTRSPALKVLRTGYAPFILYPAKVLPKFAAQVVEHPWRFLTLVAAWGALDAWAREQVGAIEEVDIDERDRRKLGYIFPGLTQVPLTDAEGGKGAVELSRYTPLSGMTDVAPPGTPSSAFSSRFPRILQPSGPFTDVASKVAINVDPFTGRQRYKVDAPVRRNIAQALEDVTQTMLPTSLGFHRQRIVEDIQNADPDALQTDLLGPLGARPRYIRPGDVERRARFQLDQSTREAEYEMNRGIERAKTPRREDAVIRRYEQWVEQAIRNYERRTGVPPSR